ncbi:MAG: formate dehydrogenase subunit alpha, partial [Clostridiales bacterium]|nr:formate dehydrogenase subunit alpha [Clostridiales bacterium]
KLGFKDGETIKVSSRRGSVNVEVKVTDIIDEDVVFMPFHYASGAANYLTGAASDPISKIPEYKVSAVKLEKVG